MGKTMDIKPLPMTTAEHDSETNKCTIYSMHGGSVLWTGIASFSKFQALADDFRRAERLAYRAGAKAVTDKLYEELDQLQTTD